jgi:hypothetical protein
MIIDRVVDVLSKREAPHVPGVPLYMTQRIGTLIVDVGAWFEPRCYQKQCQNLRERSAITRESQECIVTGIGQIIIGAVQGELKVDLGNLRKIIDDVRPALEGVQYDQVYEQPMAEVMHKFAPLHDE